MLLQFQQSAFTTDESTLIKCNAIGGEPRDFHNLTLWKNGQQLAQVTGDYLSYITQFHPYGTYTCAVDGITNSSLLLERGSMNYREQWGGRGEGGRAAPTVTNRRLIPCTKCSVEHDPNKMVQRQKYSALPSPQLQYNL